MTSARRWLAVIAWSALILMTSSDLFSAAQTGTFLQHLIGREPPYALNLAFRKVMHLLGYGILGALAYRATRADLRRLPAIAALGVVLLVSSIDEWHQSTTAHRSGSEWDVLLDLAGAIVAISFLRRVTKYPQETIE